MATILGKLDVPIVLAGSGAGAAVRMRSEDFSLVILDMHVFELDGLETAALLKRVDRTRAVPIVVLINEEPSSAVIVKNNQTCAVDFVRKPISADVLVPKVRGYLDLHERRFASSEALVSLDATSGRVSERLMAVAREIDDPLETVDALVRIHTALSEGLDLGRIAQRLVDETTSLIDASGGAFYYTVWSAKVDGSRPRKGADSSTPAPSGHAGVGGVNTSATMDAAFAGNMREELLALGPSCPFLERVFRGVAPLRVDLPVSEQRPTGLPENVRSLLAIPVLSRRGEVAGAIVLVHEEEAAFDARHEELAAMAARDAAASFDNARLYEEAKEARHRAELAELELRVGEARRRIALESAGLGTWDYHPLTGALRWDSRAKALAGLGPQVEVSYSVWMSGIHPEDRDDVDRAIKRALDPATSGRFSCEYRMRGVDDGIERWISAKGQGIVEHGRTARFIGTFLDVTANRRVEEERSALLAREQQARAQAERAHAEAEAASRSKDEFLATVSHELRNPLNAIVGWSRILIEGKDDMRSDRFHRGIEVIARNARAQVRLVEDILDVSRIVSGKLRLATSIVDVQSVVEACIDTMKPAAQAKGVSLEVTFEEDPGTIVADEDRMRQILWNLTSNAVKFTPGGGRVHIRTWRTDESVHFCVEDTGTGISPEFLPFVFDRFRQADGSTSRAYGGLGLGLAIVRHLIELHGGTVFAQSPGLGQGATFEVRLPLRACCRPSEVVVERESTGVTAIGALPLTRRRIMVVEEDEDTRDLVSMILEHAGAMVVSESTAEGALTALVSMSFDLVLVDLTRFDERHDMLVRLAREMRRVRPETLPLVAMARHVYARERAFFLEYGFRGYVEKPIATAAFVEHVTRAIALTADKQAREGRSSKASLLEPPL